jgi:hypothetical protein
MKLRAAVLSVLALAASSAGLVAANPALAGPGTAPPGTVSPAACPDNGWSNRDGSHFGTFTGTDVRIRSGPSTGCGAFGQGEPGDSLQFHCWKVGSDGFTWSHLIDRSRRGANGQFLQGWSRDTFLTDAGAFTHC